MKKKRQKKILEIIAENEISTQEDLKTRLEEEGFQVVQSTLSRDINELNLIKERTAGGSLKYSVLSDMPRECPAMLRDSVTEIAYAANTVVIKCRQGTAQAACVALDNIGFDQIVGTIAGDDTIFALLKTEEKAERFSRDLKKFIR